MMLCSRGISCGGWVQRAKHLCGCIAPLYCFVALV
jgi:hypothetical protein